MESYYVSYYSRPHEMKGWQKARSVDCHSLAECEKLVEIMKRNSGTLFEYRDVKIVRVVKHTSTVKDFDNGQFASFKKQ